MAWLSQFYSQAQRESSQSATHHSHQHQQPRAASTQPSTSMQQCNAMIASTLDATIPLFTTLQPVCLTSSTWLTRLRYWCHQGFDTLHLVTGGPMLARGNFPSPLSRPFPISPPSTVSFSILSFPFFSFLLHLFSCFSIPSHFTRIVRFRFQAGCFRIRLNLALFFVCWFCVICVFS